MKNLVMVNLRGERSQSKVAKEMGIPKSTYSMVENGKRFPRRKLAEKFVNYFGVTFDHLFFSKPKNDEQGNQNE